MDNGKVWACFAFGLRPWTLGPLDSFKQSCYSIGQLPWALSDHFLVLVGISSVPQQLANRLLITTHDGRLRTSLLVTIQLGVDEYPEDVKPLKHILLEVCARRLFGWRVSVTDQRGKGRLHVRMWL